MNDLTIYHRDNIPRQEFHGRRPYSDEPEDYETYIEDDHFVNGPRQPEPRYDEDGHFIDPPPLAGQGMVSPDGRFGGYVPYRASRFPPDRRYVVEPVNWQKDGF